ncbi:hypothetical protein GCM10007209_03600 [Haloferax sulfurifontis]|uniref:DUF1059 domain-containing protein n=2 Tax=Haloferax sulfurifontis TaxID=255616 RepID=A0A830DRA0_9EURY|nr:hypothetical protein GCM10007209_03600 [Haloferax sulfurifontis]
MSPTGPESGRRDRDATAVGDPPATGSVMVSVNTRFALGARISLVMSKAMQQATCSCGFSVTSENRNEVVKVIQEHAHDEHGKAMTRDDVLAMMKRA